MRDVPDINAWVKRDFGVECDYSEFVGNPMNVCLIAGEGAGFFVWRGPGIYEVHISLEQRGRAAMATVRKMLAMMRDNGAQMFWAAVPIESRRVIMFTRLMGWKSRGVREFPHGYCELFTGE